MELSGRREIFNNEISDLLETKGKQNGPAYGKINSDEYPTIPSDIPFLPPNVDLSPLLFFFLLWSLFFSDPIPPLLPLLPQEAMTDDEFKWLMDDDLSNLILEVPPFIPSLSLLAESNR